MNPEISAEKWTDKELARLEKRIHAQYAKASKEVAKTAEDYFKKYAARYQKEHLAMLTTTHTKEEVQKMWVDLYGSPSGFERWFRTADHAYGQTAAQAKQAFQQWEQAQLGRGEHWKQLQNKLAARVADSSKIAAGYVNGKLPSVYCKNGNAIADLAQDSAIEQGIVGIKFDMYDEHVVKKLMESSSEVRPYRKVEISMDETKQWSKNKLQNALLQGILQGDDIYAIAKRFQTAVGMSETAAIRNARTAFTGACNAGKYSRYEELASMGCETTKTWHAAGDSRTRPEHAQADADYSSDDDGIPYDEPFEVGGEPLMYPADPDGSPWNICNCRCSMHTGRFKFHSVLTDAERKAAHIRVK